MSVVLTNSIRNDIRSALTLNADKNIELEARFTDFTTNNGVDPRVFDRLISHFSTFSKEEIYTEDLNYNQESLRLTRDVTGNLKIIKKQRIQGFPIRSLVEKYGIKIGLSTEDTVVKTEAEIKDIQSKVLNEPDTSTRIKNRTSYILHQGEYRDVRLDLTKVEMVTFDANKKYKISDTRYEVELEMLKDYNSWCYFIDVVITVIQNTNYIYTKEQYLDIIKFTNNNLGNHSDYQVNVDSKSLMDARNLKYRDLVYGGIIKSNPDGVRYRVSIKSDGLRKLLVVHREGLWLLWDTEATKILTVIPGDSDTQYILNNYHGYIFDGELIPKEAKKDVTGVDKIKQPYWYLVFDMLCININNSGIFIDQTIRTEDHTVRMGRAQVFVDNLTKDTSRYVEYNKLMFIQTKVFKEIPDVISYFRVMIEIDNDRLISPYKDDGFIFVPDNSPYIRNTNKLSDRILTRSADICKAKFMDLTIDFAVSYQLTRENKMVPIIQGYSKYNKIYILQYINNSIKPHPALSELLHASVLVESKISKEKTGEIRFVYPKILNLYNVHSDSLVNFKWNGEYYIGEITTGRPDNLKIISKNVQGRQSFKSHVEWKYLENSRKIAEMYYIDSNNPYVDINKPIDVDNEMLVNLPLGMVVEFKWVNNKFVPVRKRLNKKYPNNISTIQDNLSLLEDPVELDTLQGKNIRLMRKYHNVIKTKLYNETSGDNLLDLGSGRGADVFKWRNYQKIVAVEPNIVHISEMVDRIRDIYKINQVPLITSIPRSELKLDLSKVKIIPVTELTQLSAINMKIIILNSGAENHQLISQVVDLYFHGKADVISMMLSLSFFWLNHTSLPDLLSTVENNLKIGGKFIYLTIDGEKVNQVFRPPINGPIVDELKLFTHADGTSDVTLKYIQGSNAMESPLLRVNFKGTIVTDNAEESGDQVESLVKLDELRQLFNSLGIFEQYRRDANSETFLNQNELLLSNLYTYGSFIRKIPKTETGHVSKFFITGVPVKPVICKTNSKGDIIEEKMEEVKCQWYKAEKLYRWGIVSYDDDEDSKGEYLNLLSAILRVIYLYSGKEYPKNVNDRFNLILEYELKLKIESNLDIDSDIPLRDKINKLTEYFKVDITILEITSNNLIPKIIKFRNHPYEIILIRNSDVYENLGIYNASGQPRFLLNNNQNTDVFLYALLGMYYMENMNSEKQKLHETDMEKLSNANIESDILSNMKKDLNK
jgi:hypothetical protein